MERRSFIKKFCWGIIGCCVLPIADFSLLAGLAEGAGTVHVVRSGETLSHLAVRYNLSVSAIKQANGLSSDLIRIGQRLYIPDASGSALVAVRARIDNVTDFTPGRWKNIIVHHSATGNGNAEIFDRSHRRDRRMVNGLGYHFIIGNGTNSGNGEIEIGPRWTRQLAGGHVSSPVYNHNSIGICLVGNFEQTHPSARQIAALTELVHYLRNGKFAGNSRFLVHREVDKTLCPGRYFPLLGMQRIFA